MPFTEGGSNGALNGGTPVTIVAAPAAATRRLVRLINIANRDTANVTLTITKVVSGGTDSVLVSAMQLAPGDTLIYDDVVVLDATTKSITAVLSGAVSTTEPDWNTTWGDAT